MTQSTLPYKEKITIALQRVKILCDAFGLSPAVMGADSRYRRRMGRLRSRNDHNNH